MMLWSDYLPRQVVTGIAARFIPKSRALVTRGKQKSNLRIAPGFVIILSLLFSILSAKESKSFVVDEVDYFIPNPPHVLSSSLPEYAPTGYSFVRRYDSDNLTDGLVGFGWSWDVTGLSGFGPGIRSFVEANSATISVSVGATGGSYEFVYNSGIIDRLNYLGVSWVLPDVFDFSIVSGKLWALTDPFGYTTTYQYSSANDLVAVTNFLGNTTTYQYDANHLLLNKTDPWGVVTNFPIVEPSTFAVFCVGLAGLGVMRRRRFKA